MEEILKEVNEGLAADNALYVNPNDVIAVQLQREMSGGSVGITLTGGTDYEAKEITVMTLLAHGNNQINGQVSFTLFQVHKVFTGSCAYKDGRLKKGDRVLAINGKRMMGLTHKDSVDILKVTYYLNNYRIFPKLIVTFFHYLIFSQQFVTNSLEKINVPRL